MCLLSYVLSYIGNCTWTNAEFYIFVYVVFLPENLQLLWEEIVFSVTDDR